MRADRAFRVAYLLIGIALAWGTAEATDSRISFFIPESFWFEILIWVLVAAFLFEPFFSGPAASLVNLASAIFIALGTGASRIPIVWNLLVFVAAAGVLFLVVDLLLRSPDASEAAISQRLSRFSRQLGVSIGTWRFILLGALALVLLTFNPPFSGPWVVSSSVVLYASAVAHLQPHRLIGALFRGQDSEALDLVAVRLFPPSELLVLGAADSSLQPGSVLDVRGGTRVAEGLVLGPSFHEGRPAIRIFVPSIRRVLADEHIDGLSVTVRPSEAPTRFPDHQRDLADANIQAIGAVAEATSMSEIVVELFEDQQARLGQLLWTLTGSLKTYWQVADARVERVSWGGDSHRAIIVRGNQLGRWDDQSVSFQPEVESPRPTELVFSGVDVGPRHVEMPAGFHSIGMVPHSRFPVAVDLREFSLHHAAILGITGTGKTHLSFDLAQALAGAGVRVICVDSTGQYSRRFHEAGVAQVDAGNVGDFLSGGFQIGIFTPGAQQPIREARALAGALFNWAREQPPLDPSAIARCVVILEEAQEYVPEQFVIDDWNLKAIAQETSRIIMQSRKFGLGFILISQRTAMVTKSALSQCNTVIAFQAVDQTGLDYLEGLCGATLVRGVPTLPNQTAISMGRGMASGRPTIVRVSDAPLIVT